MKPDLFAGISLSIAGANIVAVSPSGGIFIIVAGTFLAIRSFL